MTELEEYVTRAIARLAYERETGEAWHLAPADPALDPEWRTRVSMNANGKVNDAFILTGEWHDRSDAIKWLTDIAKNARTVQNESLASRAEATIKLLKA